MFKNKFVIALEVVPQKCSVKKENWKTSVKNFAKKSQENICVESISSKVASKQPC